MPAPLECSQLSVQQRRSQSGKYPVKEPVLGESVKQILDIVKAVGKKLKHQDTT